VGGVAGPFQGARARHLISCIFVAGRLSRGDSLVVHTAICGSQLPVNFASRLWIAPCGAHRATALRGDRSYPCVVRLRGERHSQSCVALLQACCKRTESLLHRRSLSEPPRRRIAMALGSCLALPSFARARSLLPNPARPLSHKYMRSHTCTLVCHTDGWDEVGDSVKLQGDDAQDLSRSTTRPG
jgi:hypothetical protein